ncbi:MAG: hypothetical protein ABW002_15845 [Xanthomonas sp.]
MPLRHRANGRATLLAVAALAAVLGDVGHELAHTAVAAATPGVQLLRLSTVGLSTLGSSPWIALAGPAFNLCAALTLVAARWRALSPAWRYFAWVFGSFNLFNALAYPVYSAVLGSGDWATVFAGVASGMVWRVPLGLFGAMGYAATIHAVGATLAALCADGLMDGEAALRACRLSYLGFAGVLVLGAVFNPVGWMLVLTSGVATGFLAMAGMLRVAVPSAPLVVPARLQPGRAWCVAGVVASVLFVAVMGPGIELG